MTSIKSPVASGIASAVQNREDVLRKSVAAMGMLPVRAVVTADRSIDPMSVDAPTNVKVDQLAPHRKIVQEAAAVVTHCGHGTTKRALAAGVPLVSLPMGGDSLALPHWSFHRGAGVRLNPADSPDAIAAALSRGAPLSDLLGAASHIDAISQETAEDRVVVEVESILREGRWCRRHCDSSEGVSHFTAVHASSAGRRSCAVGSVSAVRAVLATKTASYPKYVDAPPEMGGTPPIRAGRPS